MTIHPCPQLPSLRIAAARAPLAALGLCMALALPGCAKDPAEQLADAAVRHQVIDALVHDPAMRGEVIERLFAAPPDKSAVVERLYKDEAGLGDLVAKILADDRGRALVVSKVTDDDAGAKTFIRMLMLTGVMGASLTQQQAGMLGMGEAYAYGNRRRTMSDLKQFGRVVDEAARAAAGAAPDCADLLPVATCLVKKLPADRVAELRLSDAWGRPFQYRSYRDGSGYALVSFATDGFYDGLGTVGPTESLDCDIVFSNGDFVQWPGSMRKEEVQ